MTFQLFYSRQPACD